jgi:hypothetical protein
MRHREPNSDNPGEALYRDALEAIRGLKRNHRQYYDIDTKAFRETLRKVCARACRMKPGPKPQRDPRIAKAARKRGAGTDWRDLYPVFIDGYARMTPYTQSLIEDGFRRKVTDYLRDHPLLKAREKTRAEIPVANSDANSAG